MGEFILGVIASLLAAALFPALSDAMSQVIVRWLSWLPVRSKVKLSGDWESSWHVQSGRFPEKVTCSSLSVNQFGRRFYARFKVGSVDFYAHGEIDAGRYVTGLWKDKTEGGYHGAFQFVIDPNSRDMGGLWIGFSTSGVVKQGVWEWHRNVAQQSAASDARNART
jgi:hypothetical protein